MKKVLCIDGMELGDYFCTGSGINPALNEDLVINGKSYSVIEELTEWYRLAEMPYSNVYLKKRFIPVSDIDESELIQQRQYETLTNETTV